MGCDGVNGGKLAFYHAGRSAYDADTFYDQHFHTGVAKRTNYSIPEFDKLVQEEQRTGDAKKPVAVLQQAGRIIMEDAPIVPLDTLAEIYGGRAISSGKAIPTMRSSPPIWKSGRGDPA